MDRIELLKPLITPARQKLAHRRLLTGEPLVNSKTGKPLFNAADVKVALLIVHEINPWEMFGKEEEAFLRGVCSDTLRSRATELRKL